MIVAYLTTWLSVHVEDRIVGGVQPDRPSVAAEALVLSDVMPARPQMPPEGRVLRPVHRRGFHEDAMVPALDLGHRVAEGVEEVLVGLYDRAGHVEGDDGVRLVDRGDLPVAFRLPAALLGDVEAVMDDLRQAPGRVVNRAVGRLEADVGAGLGTIAVLADAMPPRAQVGPEARQDVFAGVEVARGAPDDLVQAVAEEAQEHLVGAQHRSLGREVENRVRQVERRDLPLPLADAGDLVRDVGDDRDRFQNRAAGPHDGGHMAADPDVRFVAPHAGPHETPGSAMVVARPKTARGLPLLRRQQDREVPADDLVRLVAEQCEQSVVGAQDPPLRVERQGREAAVERLQLGLGLVRLGRRR